MINSDGFVDMRCSICNHAPEAHWAGFGQCYDCPADKRCVKWVGRNDKAINTNKKNVWEK